MGLDQYLELRRSTYLKKGKRTIDLDNLKAGFKDYKSDEFGCSNRIGITEVVGCWRKANAIHRWFVTNCQEGEDDCREAYVSTDQLHELYDTCKTILKMVNGKKFVLMEDSKKWMEEDNERAVKNGKKPQYDLKKNGSFTFDAKNLKAMFKKGLWDYNIEDAGDAFKSYVEDNLAPVSGFFFGSTEVDGGYIYDIVHTILMLDRLFKRLKEMDEDKVFYDLYYKSSW